MSQLALPLDEPSKRPTPYGAAKRREARRVSEDEIQSSEEIKVQVVTQAGGAARYTSPASVQIEEKGSRRAAAAIVAWPAALTWTDALNYTAFSPAQLRRWEKAGALRFRRIGRHGAKVVMRSELDQLLELIFAPGPPDISEDFDFG